MFSAHFEPVVTRFGSWKIQKCLENGSFWNQKRVKSGSKTRFSKSDPGPYGMLKQVFVAHFEPIRKVFGPCKIPKCREKRRFWEQKWVKNGSRLRFSKSDPGPSGVHKQVFLAHFEPVLIDFSPFRHVHAPSCTLRTYLTETKHVPYLGLSGSNANSEGTKSTRNPPLFVVSKPQNCPTSHLDPRTSGHLVLPEGSSARARLGPTVGPPGSPGRNFFSKVVPRPLGMLKQVFLDRLSSWWHVLGHGKSQNALKMGHFGTKNVSKMGQKRVFPKVILHHFGCSYKCFCLILSPW